MRKTLLFYTNKTISLNDFLRTEIYKLPEFAEKISWTEVAHQENFASVDSNPKLEAVSFADAPSEKISPQIGLNSKIRRLIVAGAVKVNGRTVTRPNFELHKGAKIECSIDAEKFFYEKSPCDIDFTLEKGDVLFEDEYLIAVNKPAFLPVEQTITGNRKNLHDSVVDYLRKQNPNLRNPPYVGIMHRLDRETSGVILFTKQRTVNKDISEQFEKHTIQKTYLAVCCDMRNGKNACDGDAFSGGKFQKGNNAFCEGKSFVVEKPLGRISPKSKAAKWGVLTENQGGLYAKTEFEILGNARKCLADEANCFFQNHPSNVENPSDLKCPPSEEIQLPQNAILVKCRPLTGRTHQIRVHLSSVGLPILGDTLYGGLPYRRIMLHSASLEFTHPVSKEKCKINNHAPKGGVLNPFVE